MRPSRLRVGVAQLGTELELEANQRKIVAFIGLARRRGCRVAVFPEGALAGAEDTPRAAIDAAIAAVRRAAAEHAIHVVTGLKYRRDETETAYNRLLVIDPTGRVLHDYDKLWGDPRFQRVPGPFAIDGTPCNAVICSDRWIRAVEELPVALGSRIMIECSNNNASEWIEELGWYWYVPRAIRNGVFVLFCNSSRQSPGRGEHGPGHGHSAIIAPDGRILASAGEENDRLLVAELDLGEATALEAMRRHHHPLLAPFWDVGRALLSGGRVEVPRHEPPVTPETSVTLAAAQIACSRDPARNLERVLAGIADAAAQQADIVAFPELALTGAVPEDIERWSDAQLDRHLARIAEAARDHRIAVVVGAPSFGDGERRRNSAFVFDASGALATRYDQLVIDRPELFEPGSSTSAMWFELGGVPGVVTIGDDVRWSELAELAGLRGAQLHLNIGYDTRAGPGATRLRQQFWVNLAGYYTLTATVNAADNSGLADASARAEGGSIIWHDFRPTTNHRREIAGRTWFCAVRLAEAGTGEGMILARHDLPGLNLIHRAMVETTAPGMRPWYDAGVAAIHSDLGEDRA